MTAAIYFDMKVRDGERVGIVGPTPVNQVIYLVASDAPVVLNRDHAESLIKTLQECVKGMQRAVPEGRSIHAL